MSKPQFKLGQKVWFISNGYPETGVIKGLWLTKWDEIVYTVIVPNYKESIYQVHYDDVLAEDNLFASKELLVKYVKEYDTDDEN